MWYPYSACHVYTAYPTMHAVLFLFCFVISTLRLLLISRYSSVLLHYHLDNNIPTPVKQPCNAWGVPFMMASSIGNIFRVTGLMCGEFTSEVPWQKPVTRSFLIFLIDLRLNKRLSKQSRRRWLETLSRSSWRHSNVKNLDTIGQTTTKHNKAQTACIILAHIYMRFVSIRIEFHSACWHQIISRRIFDIRICPYICVFSRVFLYIFDGQTYLQMAAAISRDMRGTLRVKSGDGGISRI